MKLRTVALAVVSAAALGMLIALPLGDRRELSIDVWFVVVAIWSTKSLVTALIGVVPVRNRTRHRRWFRRREPTVSGRRTRDILSLEGLLVRAGENPRAHAMQLRPRLAEIADHFLPIRHGVDPSRDPQRAQEVLGEVAWLVDPDSDERTPSLGEIDRFLDIVLAEDRFATVEASS